MIYTQHTSAGKQSVLVEGLSHDLESVPDRFSCPFCVAGVGRSNYQPVLNLINQGGIPRAKSDQNHVDKRILGGKRLQYEDSTSITFFRPV